MDSHGLIQLAKLEKNIKNIGNIAQKIFDENLTNFDIDLGGLMDIFKNSRQIHITIECLREIHKIRSN